MQTGTGKGKSGAQVILGLATKENNKLEEVKVNPEKQKNNTLNQNGLNTGKIRQHETDVSNKAFATPHLVIF